MEETSLARTLKRLVSSPKSGTMAYAIAIILFVASLWLPPFSIGNRYFHWDATLIGAKGGELKAKDGAQVTIPEGAVDANVRLKLNSIASAELKPGAKDKVLDAAAKAMASMSLAPLGENVYRFEVYGQGPKQAVLTVPLPEGAAADVVDLYTWDGASWQFAPARVIAGESLVEAQLGSLPSAAALVQLDVNSPSVSIVVEDESAAVDKASDIIGGTAAASGSTDSFLNAIHPDGFHVNADGTVTMAKSSSNLVSVPQGYFVLPVVDNQPTGQPDAALLSAVLATAESRAKNVESIVSLVVDKGYAGVQVDYQGVDESLSEAFTSFVSELKTALGQQGKLLAVSVAEPVQVSDDTWNTGGYNWRALGQIADVLIIPALESPSAYQAGGKMEALLRWAVGEVSRDKLQIAISAYSHKVVDGVWTRIPYAQAMSELCEVVVEGDKQILEPGENVTLALPNLTGEEGLKFDEATSTYHFSCKNEAGKDTELWLENAASIAHKLQLVSTFNVRGVSLENVFSETSDERIDDVLRGFRNLSVPPVPSKLSVTWTIEGVPEGQTTVQSPLTSPNLVWTAPEEPGDFTVRAVLSDDGAMVQSAPGNPVSLEVPSPTPTMTPTPKPTSRPQSPAAPPAPPSTSGRGPGFAYGIQGDAITDGDHGRLFGKIRELGFGWFKQQVEWFRYNPGPGQYDWGALDRIVDSASAHGIKVLFSVVKAPSWARPPGDTDQGPPADPATYATFVRELAARYKGRVQAYEIWNEQNLYYEWGGRGGKLNAGKYVQLLKAAYQAIKSVDPSATVVSGALTPTGYNDGDIAIDDRTYLEQMYQAGLKNYCDAVGAHPSGFNNPPDADWRTFSDPSASFQAKGHPSWFFRGTMEAYRNIMVKYGDGGKRIWPTEFGWASVDGLGVAPARGYEYAADNTEAEQAQYIVRAYQMAKGWGWVGPMFLWNLNFAPICGPADEKSAFGIVRNDWSSRQAFAALAGMPK